MEDAEAFPSLGGGGKRNGGGAGSQSGGGGGSGGSWTKVAASAPVYPPAGSSSFLSSVAAPPKEYNAAPQEFPSLGAAVTVERAKSKATIPKDRDELILRNKLLMSGLQAAAKRNGSHDAVADFRTLSGAFQRGEVTSMAYFKQFNGLFGDETTHALFPELVLLLPDQAKREELSRVFDAFDRSRPLLGQQVRACGAAPTPAMASAGFGVFASGRPATWGGRGRS